MYLSLFPSSQLPCLPRSPGRPSVPFLVHVNYCLGLSLSYLCWGPQSTWPPGLCPAGSQAAGAAARAAGSCSLPSPFSLAWTSRTWNAGWATLNLSLTLDLCTFTTTVLKPPGHVGQGINLEIYNSSETWPSLTCPVILGNSLLFPGPQFPHL